MSTRCKPGDLAIVVRAHNPSNIGTIVKVIGLYDGTGDLPCPEATCAVWLIESTKPTTWIFNGKRYRRKRGPVPDSQLQPIRGNPSGKYEDHQLEKQDEDALVI